jgi:hypothetical protein
MWRVCRRFFRKPYSFIWIGFFVRKVAGFVGCLLEL